MSDISLRLPDFNGCRVAVFIANAVSGSTLGYYGTVTAKLCTGMYLVHIPVLNRECSVSVGDMLIFQSSAEMRRLVPLDSFHALCPGDWHFEMEDSADMWSMAKQQLEIEFESPPQSDNAVLRGKYRVGVLEKGRFEFKKVDRAMPSYRFRMPAKTLGSSRGKLKCEVPSGQVLDRAYVMRTLAELLAMASPRERQATTA